jgi:hypothetical protein
MRAPVVFAVIALATFSPATQWAEARAARTGKSAAATALQNLVAHPKRALAPLDLRRGFTASSLGGPQRYDAKKGAVIGGEPRVRKR